jgi:nucleotide-binding universal stress UspA family protein/CheY-like chemotaxis protein
MGKKILVPVDGSTHALKAIEFAAMLAGQDNTTVHILNVAKEGEFPEAFLDYINSEGIKENPQAVLLQFAEKEVVGPAQKAAKSRGIKNIETETVSGDPAEKIIEYASHHDIDVIVMGSRGLSSAKTTMMGGVTTKVCYGTTRSCVIVRKDLLEDKRVLVVDDEHDVAETIEDLLPMCEVQKAYTFREAKELLETQGFDLAVLDIMGVDGYKLLDIAKERGVIAVMLTAHALSPNSLKKSREKGAASFIPKDRMTDIAIYLKDVLEAAATGKSSWWRWVDRLGSYFEGKFGSEWQRPDFE